MQHDIMDLTVNILSQETNEEQITYPSIQEKIIDSIKEIRNKKEDQTKNLYTNISKELIEYMIDNLLCNKIIINRITSYDNDSYYLNKNIKEGDPEIEFNEKDEYVNIGYETSESDLTENNRLSKENEDLRAEFLALK